MPNTRALAEIKILLADGTVTDAEALYYEGERDASGAWVLPTLLTPPSVALAEVDEGDRPAVATALRALADRLAPLPAATPIAPYDPGIDVPVPQASDPSPAPVPQQDTQDHVEGSDQEQAIAVETDTPPGPGQGSTEPTVGT